jgi:hypothetical protein
MRISMLLLLSFFKLFVHKMVFFYIVDISISIKVMFNHVQKFRSKNHSFIVHIPITNIRYCNSSLHPCLTAANFSA